MEPFWSIRPSIIIFFCSAVKGPMPAMIAAWSIISGVIFGGFDWSVSGDSCACAASV